MQCPSCRNLEDKVVDSRESTEGEAIRRRRECLKCGRRFTTYERIEEHPLMVVKKDGRREPFDRNKVLSGLQRACEKRPITTEQIEAIVDQLERGILRDFDKEVTSQEIGERLMRALHDLDEVAYVRFASVYRSFKDVSQFMTELKELLSEKAAARPKV